MRMPYVICFLLTAVSMSASAADLKLGRLRLRGPRGAQDEFTLAAIAQNLRRLARLVVRPPPTVDLCLAWTVRVSGSTGQTRSAPRRAAEKTPLQQLEEVSSPLLSPTSATISTQS